MFEDARHFPGRRRHARDGHDRMPIDFEDFVGPIINDGIARRRAPIASYEHAPLELESENGSRLGERDVRARLSRSHRTYGSYVSHAPEQPDEILSSACASVHH